MNALDKVIEAAGSQQKLASLIGGVQTRVSEWRRRGQVPADAVLAVCEAVEFAVTPHQLRPDIYPHPDDGLPEPLRNQAAA